MSNTIGPSETILDVAIPNGSVTPVYSSWYGLGQYGSGLGLDLIATDPLIGMWRIEASNDPGAPNKANNDPTLSPIDITGMFAYLGQSVGAPGFGDALIGATVKGSVAVQTNATLITTYVRAVFMPSSGGGSARVHIKQKSGFVQIV